MPLFNDLIETYNTYHGHERSDERPIAPVAHMFKSCPKGIVITIKDDGTYVSGEAFKREKGDQTVLIPITERSGARTSGAAKTLPYGLNDKIRYMAKDHFIESGVNPSWKAYTDQLREWSESPDSCPQVKAVLSYITDHDPIIDLQAHGAVKTDEDLGTLGDQMLLWRVIITGAPEEEVDTWKNKNVRESWTKFYTEYHRNEPGTRHTVNIMDGRYEDVEELHIKPIPAYGNAKLISDSTKEGNIYNYSGERFTDKSQGANISYLDAQKADNALSWVIATKGVTISQGTVDRPTYLACWRPHFRGNDNVPLFLRNILQEQSVDYTDYRKKLNDALTKGKLQEGIKDNVSVLMTASATDGRFAATMYRSFSAQEYLERMVSWYVDYNWRRYDAQEKKTEIWVPSVFGIVKAAYGNERGSQNPRIEVDDKLFEQSAIQLLVDCVLNGRPAADPVIMAAAGNAANPQRYQLAGNYEYVLRTACALVHGKRMRINKNEGSKDMELDRTVTDRDYLYGRALAVFDRIESYALYIKDPDNGDNKRTTNAKRLWNAYVARPQTVFAELYKSAIIYLGMLPAGTRAFYENELQEIVNLGLLKPGDTKPLSPYYLLGYFNEREALYMKKENK